MLLCDYTPVCGSGKRVFPVSMAKDVRCKRVRKCRREPVGLLVGGVIGVGFGGDFFDSLFGFGKGLPAVLYQGHTPFVLFEAVLERNLSLLDFADDFSQFPDCLLEAEFVNVFLFVLLSHFSTVTF